MFNFSLLFFFFFFNDTATTEIYTLSLHDALPISLAILIPVIPSLSRSRIRSCSSSVKWVFGLGFELPLPDRSEEHTSELQSRLHLVCRLLLEKKKHRGLHAHHAIQHMRSTPRISC